jgi:hypothetical protein
LDIKVADEVWIGCALLHKENPQEVAFSSSQIADRVGQENIYGSIRPGIQVHISTHCIANMPAQPNKCRMLYRLPDGRKRLFKATDDYHQSREHGKTMPNKEDIPQKYLYITDWYEREYNQKSKEQDPPSPPPPPPVPVKIISLKENQLYEFTYNCPKPTKLRSCKDCPLFLEEDKIKNALEAALSNQGWIVKTSMGKKHGVDIMATDKENRLMLIEAKGEGSRNAMRVNYFLMVLGELLQKMDSPSKLYGLALPAHRQYANLIIGLPDWIKQQMRLRIYLVKQQENGGYHIGLVEYN